jgi:hypothetical protein
MLGLGMWVFSATFNKNYFSYLVAITFTDGKNRLQRKCLFFPEGTYIFYYIEFIEDTCHHDWESSSQQVALGTDWM